MRTARLFVFSLTASLCTSAVATAQTTSTPAGHAGMHMQGGAGGDTALLTGPLGTRTPTGAAVVEGRTVRVTLAGDQPGSTRLWYLHRGSCARDEGMVGAARAYRPIAVDAHGSGSGSVTLDAPLAEDRDYYVAVHASATDPTSDVIACGPLMKAARRAGQLGARKTDTLPVGNMPAMDHAAMGMAGTAMPGTAMPGTAMHGMGGMVGMAGTDSMAALLMAVHRRMMADVVIRERVMTDPVLRSMLARMPASEGATPPTGAARAEDAPSARPTPPTQRPTATAKPVAKPAAKPAAKPVAKPVAEPGARRAAPENRPAADPHAGHQMPPATRPATPKPAAKPAAAKPTSAKKDSMPGMDHSKMPGMGKP